MKILLPLIFLLYGCGADYVIDAFSGEIKMERTRAKPFIDPELKPYIDSYIKFSDENGLGRGHVGQLTRVEFVDELTGGNVGECNTYMHQRGLKAVGWRNIYILKVKYSEYELKALMMHELAHCVHGADHIDKVPHIMNPYLNSENVLRDNWDELTKSLAEYIKSGEK